MNKILVVDDEIDLLEEMHEALEELGFRCVCASSIEDAICEMGRHSDIDLIITDLPLPGRSDFHALLRLAAGVDGSRVIPVVVSSGHIGHGDEMQLLRQGGVKFLPKPVDYEGLVGLLQGFFPGHQMT